MKSALEIAHEAQLRPITEIASAAGIQPDELEQSGLYRGKVRLSILERLAKKPDATRQTDTSARPIETATVRTPEPAPSHPAAVAPKAPVASLASTEPAPSDAKSAAAKPRAVRPSVKPMRRPPLGVAKASSADSTEDTLFSGRK